VAALSLFWRTDSERPLRTKKPDVVGRAAEGDPRTSGPGFAVTARTLTPAELAILMGM
jgi:hypothetical protein